MAQGEDEGEKKRQFCNTLSHHEGEVQRMFINSDRN